MRKKTATSQERNWHLYDVADSRLFLLALDHLFPQDCVLVMEFSGIPKALARESKALGLLGMPEKRVPISDSTHSDTRVFMQLTRAGLRRLFGSAEFWLKIDFWLQHVHVVRSKTLLMSAYDLAAMDGFMVSHTITEDAIKQFCTRVSCEYEEVREPL